MSAPIKLEPLDYVILALLAASGLFAEWARSRQIFGRALHRIRVRAGRQAPVGTHRLDKGFHLRVGVPDTTLVFRFRLRAPDGSRELSYTAATDDATRFTVRGEPSTVDGFLEAYDDEMLPVLLEVAEPGRVSSAGIGE